MRRKPRYNPDLARGLRKLKKRGGPNIVKSPQIT